MRLLFITDIHGRGDGFDRLPGAEVAVLGGDLTQFGTVADVGAVLDQVGGRFPRVLAVLGNCDPPAGEAVLGARNVSLHGRTAEAGGVLFAGYGGSNTTPFRTPNEWREEDVAPVLGALAPPAGLPVVLVSHAPPRGSGADRLPNGASAGSEAVAAWVRAQRPALVLCGHIHEAVGQFAFEETTVVNPGAFRAGRYALIEVAPDGVLTRVELGRS